MEIKVGAKYKTRDGFMAKVIDRVHGTLYPYRVQKLNRTYMVLPDGKQYLNGNSVNDLVEYLTTESADSQDTGETMQTLELYTEYKLQDGTTIFVSQDRLGKTQVDIMEPEVQQSEILLRTGRVYLDELDRRVLIVSGKNGKFCGVRIQDGDFSGVRNYYEDGTGVGRTTDLVEEIGASDD